MPKKKTSTSQAVVSVELNKRQRLLIAAHPDVHPDGIKAIRDADPDDPRVDLPVLAVSGLQVVALMETQLSESDSVADAWTAIYQAVDRALSEVDPNELIAHMSDEEAETFTKLGNMRVADLARELAGLMGVEAPGELGEPKIHIEPGAKVPIQLTPDMREALIHHTQAPAQLTDRLKLTLSGEDRFDYTLDELDELFGHIAFAPEEDEALDDEIEHRLTAATEIIEQALATYTDAPPGVTEDRGGFFAALGFSNRSLEPGATAPKTPAKKSKEKASGKKTKSSKSKGKKAGRSKSAKVKYLEFEVRLLDFDPPPWRRFMLREDLTFWDLHIAIQVACEWEESHLFEFRTDKRSGDLIAGMDVDLADPVPPADELALTDHFRRTGTKCRYIYDFGDYWAHEVKLVKSHTLPRDCDGRFVGGELAFPLEDCGGPPGYDSCALAARIRDKEVEASDDDLAEVEDYMEWIGDDWHPDRFDESYVQSTFDEVFKLDAN